MSDYLVPCEEKYNFAKVMKCKNLINMKSMLLVIYYHLFIFYEAKGEESYSFFYLKKILSTTCFDLIPGFYELVARNKTNFGEAAGLVLNPTVQFMIHRVAQQNFPVLLRVKATLFRMTGDPEHEELLGNHQYKMRFLKLQQLGRSLERLIRYSMATLARLNQKYYYAWRTTKSYPFLVEVSRKDVYYKYVKDDTEITFDLPIENLDELNLIVDLLTHSFAGHNDRPKPQAEERESNQNGAEDDKDYRLVTPVSPQAEFTESPHVAHANGTPYSVSGSVSSEGDEFKFVGNAENWDLSSDVKKNHYNQVIHDQKSNGHVVNGQIVNGQVVNGTIQGQPSNGNIVNGPIVNGQVLNGHTLNVPEPVLNGENLNAQNRQYYKVAQNGHREYVNDRYRQTPQPKQGLHNHGAPSETTKSTYSSSTLGQMFSEQQESSTVDIFFDQPASQFEGNKVEQVLGMNHNMEDIWY